jgi:hypothetical protein
MAVKLKKKQKSYSPVIVGVLLCFVGVIAYINERRHLSFFINLNVMEEQMATPAHTEQASSLPKEIPADLE